MIVSVVVFITLESSITSSKITFTKLNKLNNALFSSVIVFKTEAAVFSCRLCFLRAFPFISLILLTTAGV